MTKLARKIQKFIMELMMNWNEREIADQYDAFTWRADYYHEEKWIRDNC
ncbi:MAG: hypothetical protein WC451_03345 [Patescibacteria group bacterium]|jgi:hypothetical protein